MEIILFKDWTLTVDREATLAAYKSVANGSADDCNCTDCKNYSANRETMFPIEVKTLLNQLGIDYRKEIEVWRMSKDENGNHLYNGFFHFKGSFLGKDCALPMQDGNGFTFSMTPISDRFSIGFRMGNDLSYFTDTSNLVQVEYETTLPWTIEKKLEPEW